MDIAEIRAVLAAGDWALALEMSQALDHPDATRLISICHTELENLDEALHFAQRAALTQPQNAATWHQLGIVHQLMAEGGPGHYLEAHMAFERAFNMWNTPVTASALGGSAVTMGQYDLALTLFQIAQRQGPYPMAEQAEGGTLLMLDRYEEGWPKLEARVELPEWRSAGAYRGTLADLRDKTVIVRAEQGYGDVIQFMRYVPRLRPYCGELIVETHAGLEAFVGMFTSTKAVAWPCPIAEDQVAINIMSLPLLLGPMIGWKPIPPLSVPGQFLRERRGIGFCPLSALSVLKPESAYTNSVGRRKRVPWEMVLELARDHGPFRSLTHEDLGTSDWFETASIIAGLNLVITIDTAVAHVAASLGIETWVLQRFDHCWRWSEGWYKSARIFKQTSPGDWGSVFDQVREALARRT